MVPVLVGTMMLVFLGAAVEMFGFVPCLVAAVLTAIAPLPLYYDRYFIHEPLLVVATLLLVIAGCKLWREPGVRWATTVGGCVALMLATKETAVLNLAAMGIAAGCLLIFRGDGLRGRLPLSARSALAAVVTFLIVLGAFYTWFGRDWRGILELVHVLPKVLARAGGEGHEKPAWYYLQLFTMGRSGWVLCCMACAGAVIALRGSASRLRFGLVCYCGSLLVVYSLIPYKTPWLGLNLWLPLLLLVGIAAEAIVRWAWAEERRRVGAAVVGVAAVLVASVVMADTWKWVYAHPADEDNPYAYAHTSEDLLGLAPAIDRLAQERGISSPRIAVIAADPWPLPWYLRQYKQVGYWQPGQDSGDADFYVTSTEAGEQYAAKLHDLRPEFFGVRPGVLVLVWSRDRAQP